MREKWRERESDRKYLKKLKKDTLLANAHLKYIHFSIHVQIMFLIFNHNRNDLKKIFFAKTLSSQCMTGINFLSAYKEK